MVQAGEGAAHVLAAFLGPTQILLFLSCWTGRKTFWELLAGRRQMVALGMGHRAYGPGLHPPGSVSLKSHSLAISFELPR